MINKKAERDIDEPKKPIFNEKESNSPPQNKHEKWVVEEATDINQNMNDQPKKLDNHINLVKTEQQPEHSPEVTNKPEEVVEKAATLEKQEMSESSIQDKQIDDMSVDPKLQDESFDEYEQRVIKRLEEKRKKELILGKVYSWSIISSIHYF